MRAAIVVSIEVDRLRPIRPHQFIRTRNNIQRALLPDPMIDTRGMRVSWKSLTQRYRHAANMR